MLYSQAREQQTLKTDFLAVRQLKSFAADADMLKDLINEVSYDQGF